LKDLALGKAKPNGVVSQIANIGLRLTAFVLVAMLFIPGVNPARITEKINRNISLLTSGFFYKNLTADMGRLLTKGWIQESTMQLVFFASMFACFGILLCAAAACMSVGNNKLKRVGYFFGIGGSAVICLSMFGLSTAHAQILLSEAVEKAKPMMPFGLKLFVILAIVAFAFSVFSLIATPAPKKDEKAHIDTSMELFLLLIPFLLLIFVFSYLPLWGWRYAFFNYQAGDVLSKDKFVGFFWFTYLFQNSATIADIGRVLTNTLAMSGLGILTSWCPLAFAIFLAEISNTRFRRIIQTFTTIPNFISWVLVYAVAFCIFSTDGFISSIMVNSGLWESGKNMLMGGEHIWLKMLAWGMWKGLGWSAIMYIATITSIDQQLYEAATVDGAGRFQKMWHVTVPELIPTYMVLLLLSIAGILNNGMEQYFCFENSTNSSPITVLDLYVYKLGIGKGLIPLSTVIGMVKSLVSVALLFGANAISKAVRGNTIV